MPGLLDVNELMSPGRPQDVAPGMGASQYTPNPNFTASLAPPQMVANPRPGFGNWMPGQQAPQAAAGAGTAPTAGGMGLTNDDVQQALGMLYGQLGVSPEQARAYSGQAGLLGNAAQGQGGAGQQSGANANVLANAFQGFQQYQDVEKQIKEFQALNNGGQGPGGYHGREGGGIV